MSTTSIIPRKRIVFCHGDKGGVGKSTFARIMADWYTQNNIPFQGFDTDSTNGQFLRFYGEKITPLALRDPSNLDQILNTLESAHDVTLVDLGARSGDILNEWFQATDLLQLQGEMNFEVTICFVLGASKDSTALLRSVAEQLGSAASYVIVKNKANGPVFELYEASKIREHVREQLCGIEIDLPHILPSTFNTVDKFNLTWGGAENDDRLQLSDRQRVRSFVRNAFAQIDQAKHYLSIVNR